MGKQQFGRPLEELAGEVTQGALLRGLLLDRGEIAMAAPTYPLPSSVRRIVSTVV
jgi:hypothetical protein